MKRLVDRGDVDAARALLQTNGVGLPDAPRLLKDESPEDAVKLWRALSAADQKSTKPLLVSKLAKSELPYDRKAELYKQTGIDAPTDLAFRAELKTLRQAKLRGTIGDYQTLRLGTLEQIDQQLNRINSAVKQGSLKRNDADTLIDDLMAMAARN